MKPAPLLALAARLGFAALLLYAAAPKLLDPAAFATAVGHYRLLPDWGNILVAHTLPWLEAVTALALLLGGRRLAGAWLLATGLSAVFAAAVASAWLRGLDISCGCFGTGSGITGRDVALRALLFAVAATACLHACRRSAPRVFSRSHAERPKNP